MRKVVIGKIYKHFKNKLYIVENIVYDCENESKYVVYRALYGECKTWIRRYDDFISLVDKVKYPNIKQKYRFEEYNDNNYYIPNTDELISSIKKDLNIYE